MKCKKCGMELGQKNICPSCGPEKKAEKKPAAVEIPPQAPSSNFSTEELTKIDEFLKAHPSDWSDEFDEFYDKQVFAANYRNTVAMCRHRAELFAAVREMLKDAQKLSADLMLRIMEEIPKKYPEIEENEARALAREFFKERKQIRKLTLKEAIGFSSAMERMSNLIGANAEEMEDMAKKGLELCKVSYETLKDVSGRELLQDTTLSWNFKENDVVKVGDILCQFWRGSMTTMISSIVLLSIGGRGGSNLGRTSFSTKLKSPWNGRIVSIRTTPVQRLDDVICEIETLD